MITIKSKSALMKMQEAGRILATLFQALKDQIVPGISADAVEQWIQKELMLRGLESCMKGYRGYKYVSCISLNDEVVHGLPTADKVFKLGDLVKVDVCASWRGYCADMARTFEVGEGSPEVKRLIFATQRALDQGIYQVQSGKYLTDISAAIQCEIEQHGFGIVRDFAGHGIGKRMHEDPEILNYGRPGQGPLMRSGMAFALEPMVTIGDFKVYVTSDGWTVKTCDGSLAAHIEDTVIVTDQGPVVITRLSL